jgi:hypothetical protein
MTGTRLALVLCLLASPIDALAQAAGPSRPLLEVTGAIGLSTGTGLGRQDANLRANNSTPQPLTLFSTESSLTRTAVVDARVGVSLTRRLAVEGRFGYSRPTLETSVRADAEGAAPIAVVERIDQYVIDAGIVVRLDEVRAARLVPYVAAGAGYLRQLHEGLTVIEQGHVYHVGGGLERGVLARTRGVIRAAGLRADARAYFLSGGISLDDTVVTQGVFSAGVFVRF